MTDPRPAPDADERITELVTVRDWARYAVSRFSAANLTYGHGTASAVDEAAFLILETLRLPIDDIGPWLDARLLPAERAALRDIVEARITTRKPAPYLTGSAYIQGRRFFVDDRVIVPRSYIGELLCAGAINGLVEGREITTILDLCTGSGALAILAAQVFPAARVTAVDISGDALDVARRNLDLHDLSDRITLVESDMFSALGKERFDLILSNPPYVARAEVDAFAPEYRAEPEIAHLGGEDGLDLVHWILSSAEQHLTPDGLLVVEVGTGRALLEERYPDLDVLSLDTEDSEGEVFAIEARALA
jgi:ribosomal protein L3 glutamine methyltransferase